MHLLSRLRSSALAEHARASLFLFPMISVVLAVAAAAASLALDRQFDDQPDELPLALVSTVDGARVLLSTIAGATISFAGIAFSISLLIFQQASNQYSPRVVHTLFRDPFNKRVMGLVMGTFTYCLIVLRSVRAPLGDGAAVVPNLSVAAAVALGILTILAIVAFIDHSAHTMDVSQILERVRLEAIGHIRDEWVDSDPTRAAVPAPGTPPTGDPDTATIRFDHTGWVQLVHTHAIVDCLPPGATLRLQAYPGRYAIEGTILGTITPAPAPADLRRVEQTVNAAVDTGNTRTMQQDASYALRQLTDVALKALSPAINDPTTAQDAIFHSAAVLAELLHRDPRQHADTVAGDRRLVLAQQPRHAELVRLAFDETRRAAAPHATVSIYMLEALELLAEPLLAAGLDDRSEPLLQQADLIVAGSRMAGLLPADLALVEAAYAKRFGPDAPLAAPTGTP